MIELKKEVEALRIWESVDVLNSLLTEIKVSNSRLASFVSSVQAILQQILKVKTLDLWVFTTDFVARLNSLEQAIGILTVSVRRFLALEIITDSELPELISQLEGVIDEARRAGILDFKIKVTNETEKVISTYTAAVVAGLEKIRTREDDYLTSIEGLKGELLNLSSEIANNKSVLAEILKSKEDFQLDLKTSNKEFLEEQSEKANSQIAEQLGIAQNAVAEIEKLASDSKKLASKVYQKTVSQEYGIYAFRQSFIGGIYSFLTVIAGAGTAALNWLLAHDVQSGTAPISNLKIFGSVASFAVFGFLAAETSGYRHQARDAKRTQLDLNSVDSAVTKLDEKDGVKLRLTVIQDTFQRPRPTITRWSEGMFAIRANRNLPKG